MSRKLLLRVVQSVIIGAYLLSLIYIQQPENLLVLLAMAEVSITSFLFYRDQTKFMQEELLWIDGLITSFIFVGISIGAYEAVFSNLTYTGVFFILSFCEILTSLKFGSTLKN